MKKHILSVLAVATSVLAFAQEKNLETIFVSGKVTSTPYHKVVENIIIIDKNQIKQSPATSIEDLLQQYSGIDIRRRGANGVQSDVSIRGGSFEQVLVLINGVRLNDAQTGHNSMTIPVELSNVEKIEIMKGPAARKFGNNAFAGVINIITKTSSQEQVKISASGGDYETRNLGLSASFGSEKIENLVQFNSSASSGYRYNTDYDIKNAFYQSKIRLAEGSLNFQAGFVEKKFGANGFYSSPNAKEQYEETQASIVSANYERKIKNFAMNVGAFWRRGQDMYLFDRNKPVAYRNMSIGNNVGANANVAHQWSLGTTEVGLATRKEFLNSNNVTTFTAKNLSIGSKERFITEAFAEHKFSFLEDKLIIVPGISWANISNSGMFFYPGLDVGYSFLNGHKIFGNIAKVNRIPSFFDLYYISGTELGNPELKPESAMSYEAGYQFLKKNTEFKTSYFARNSMNGIDWVRNTTQEQWRSQNIGDIFTQGVDIEVSQRFRGITERFSVGYTYIDTKINQSSTFSKYLAEHFRHQFVAKWNAQLGKYFTNQLTYRYQERINGYSYNLLDEKFSFQQNNLSIYLLINNVTNVDYVEAFGVPMPKRWFHIGFNWNFKFN